MTAPRDHDRRFALGTLSGLLAVFIWSTTAPVVTAAVGVSPFLYQAIDHGIAVSFFALKWLVLRRNPLTELRAVPLGYYVAGIIGMVTHGLTWVAALQQAPPLEATLIIYLWPLLVVIFTTIALRQRLRWYHGLGGAIGLLGTVLMMMGRGLNLDHFTLLPGHGWALLCALSWSVFAALSARQKQFSSDIYSIIFLISCLGNAAYWWWGLDAPAAPTRSLIIVVCAALPTVMAYMLWDFGTKHGDTQLIGVASFLTPVLAACYLVLLDQAAMTPYLALALLCVMSGIGVTKYGKRLSGQHAAHRTTD